MSLNALLADVLPFRVTTVVTRSAQSINPSDI